MKHIKALLFTSLISLNLAGSCLAALPGLLTQERQDWSFIQKVGGMKVTLVEKRLQVDCDVSGTTTVTVKPTQVNSAMAVRKLKTKRKGNTIKLWVVTSVIEKGLKTTCGSIDLSKYPAGSYTVEYADSDGGTHALGTIQLPAPVEK